MADFQDAWAVQQRRRWMRPNAHLYIRHDVYRFMPPGSPLYVGRDVVKYFWPDSQSDRPGQAQPHDRKFDPGHADVLADDWARYWETEHEIRQIRGQLASLKLELALARFGQQCKAHYDPNQPRVPANNPGGGQWTRVAGGPPGIGHNQGPPLGDPPTTPKTRPSTEKAKNDFLKAAARWLSAARAVGARISPFVAAYEAMSWLDTDRVFIETYQDPAKSLEELQQAASSPGRGYNIHHIVEQTPAENAGFPRSIIDGADNLTRIPTLKHWEINRWFSKEKLGEKYQGRSPREYLRGKDWEERRNVGLEALIENGVLKP